MIWVMIFASMLICVIFWRISKRDRRLHPEPSSEFVEAMKRVNISIQKISMAYGELGTSLIKAQKAFIDFAKAFEPKEEDNNG